MEWTIDNLLRLMNALMRLRREGKEYDSNGNPTEQWKKIHGIYLSVYEPYVRRYRKGLPEEERTWEGFKNWLEKEKKNEMIKEILK